MSISDQLMWRYFELLSFQSLNEINLLKQFGMFNIETNTKGVVRDHIYGRKSGFKEKVPPEILRHPANCEIILHSSHNWCLSM